MKPDCPHLSAIVNNAPPLCKAAGGHVECDQQNPEDFENCPMFWRDRYENLAETMRHLGRARDQGYQFMHEAEVYMSKTEALLK